MDVIENKGGKFVSATGPDATAAYRIRVLISGLKLESRGIKVSRGVNCLKAAKLETGLRTNDRAIHIDRLEKKLEQMLAKLLIINDGV